MNEHYFYFLFYDYKSVMINVIASVNKVFYFYVCKLLFKSNIIKNHCKKLVYEIIYIIK